MDSAGPFNKKWKVDFLSAQYSTDNSSKGRHYPSTNTNNQNYNASTRPIVQQTKNYYLLQKNNKRITKSSIYQKRI